VGAGWWLRAERQRAPLTHAAIDARDARRAVRHAAVAALAGPVAGLPDAMSAVNYRAPTAAGRACAELGFGHYIQSSTQATKAERAGQVPYSRWKSMADFALARMQLPVTILSIGARPARGSRLATVTVTVTWTALESARPRRDDDIQICGAALTLSRACGRGRVCVWLSSCACARVHATVCLRLLWCVRLRVCILMNHSLSD
jgi:hypothetical protein